MSLTVSHTGIVPVVFENSVSALTCVIGEVNSSAAICVALDTHSQLLASAEESAAMILSKLTTLEPKDASDWLEAAPLLTDRGILAGMRFCPEIRARIDSLATRPELSELARVRILNALRSRAITAEDRSTAEKLISGSINFSEMRSALGFESIREILDDQTLSRVLEKAVVEEKTKFQVVRGIDGCVFPGLTALAESLGCTVVEGRPADWVGWKVMHTIDCIILYLGSEPSADLCEADAISLAVECYKRGWIRVDQLEDIIIEADADFVKARKVMTSKHQLNDVSPIDSMEKTHTKQVTQVVQTMNLTLVRKKKHGRNQRILRVIRVIDGGKVVDSSSEREEVAVELNTDSCDSPILDFKFIPE